MTLIFDIYQNQILRPVVSPDNEVDKKLKDVAQKESRPIYPD